jgi:hypothetical protein
LNGTVTYYHPTRLFGFVEDSQGTSYFFYNETDKYKRRRRFYPGDEVLFEVIPGSPDKTARIIEYTGNENYKQLIEQVRTDPGISGFLKQFPNGNWAIKQMPSKIFIELKGPGLYETDVESLYDQRLNGWVDAIVKLNRHDEMTAILADRRFVPGYHVAKELFASGDIIHAVVTGQNEDVVFTEILRPPVSATILKKKFEIDYSSLKKRQAIPVKVIGVSDSSIRLEPVTG